MAANFQPIAIRPQMVGVVDHPRREPEQFPLHRRKRFQLFKFRFYRPHLIHVASLEQSRRHGNHWISMARIWRIQKDAAPQQRLEHSAFR